MGDGEIFYQDRNNDGVPDVFENRPPISEILNDDNQANATSKASPSFQDFQDAGQALGPRYEITTNSASRAITLSSEGRIVFTTIAELWQFIEDLKVAGRKVFGGIGPVNF